MVISMSESIVKYNRILRIAFLSLFALLTVAFFGGDDGAGGTEQFRREHMVGLAG